MYIKELDYLNLNFRFTRMLTGSYAAWSYELGRPGSVTVWISGFQVDPIDQG